MFFGGCQSHSSSFSSMSSRSSWFGRSLPLYMGLSPPAPTSSSWSPRHGCTHNNMHQDAEASSRILGIFYILPLGDGAILCLDPRLVSLFVYVGSKYQGCKKKSFGERQAKTVVTPSYLCLKGRARLKHCRAKHTVIPTHERPCRLAGEMAGSCRR